MEHQTSKRSGNAQQETNQPDATERDNVYEAYPEIEIPKYHGAQETIEEYFGAEVDAMVAMMWADSYGTVRNLAGQVIDLLEIGRGVDEETIEDLCGGPADHRDQTIAHAQQKRGLGPFAGEEGEQ